MTTVGARIDPLQACPHGRYTDHRVAVERVAGARLHARVGDDGRIALTHGLRAVDDEIGSDLAAVLAPLTDEHDVFARAFTGLVLTTAAQPIDAWLRFYRHTLDRIHRPEPGYSAIYRHALPLLPRTSVLDLGASFGFLSLHLAARGTAVTACDIDPGTTGLLHRVARRLGARVDVVLADHRVPLPAGAVDAVALLHVLEHVDAGTGAGLLAEAMRVARHRVVVAVPYEASPTALFGHIRSFGPHDLHELGAATGWRYEVHEHHGGWLVLDRHPRTAAAGTAPAAR